MKIGFIGCGNMGGGMAAHLLDLKQDITCFDPDQSNLDKVVNIGAKRAESAQDLVRACDFIILSLPKADVVRAVMSEIHEELTPDTIIIDTSTSEPETTKAMSAQAEQKS